MTLKSGKEALCCLYIGRNFETLNKIGIKKFNEKAYYGIAGVDPKTLPPTLDAAKCQSLRVY